MSEIDDSSLYPIPNVPAYYVIYDHPRDHPDYYVVRPWDAHPGESAPRPRIAPNGQPVCGLFAKLDNARAYCAQFGLVLTARAERDDPSILEVWI